VMSVVERRALVKIFGGGNLCGVSGADHRSGIIHTGEFELIQTRRQSGRDDFLIETWCVVLISEDETFNYSHISRLKLTRR